jgi:hypothetical protein
VYPPRSREAKLYFAIDCNLGGRWIVKIGGLRQADEHHASPNMTHHDVPFVVSLIWLAALNGGMVLLLLW